MSDKDDVLGLTLSLGFGGGGGGGENRRNPPPPPPPFSSFMPSASTFPFMQPNHHHHHQQPPLKLAFLADTFHSSAGQNNVEPRSLFLGIDVNQPARGFDVGGGSGGGGGDEEVIVSSPHSTVSSLSGKKSIEREEDIDAERGGGSSSQEDDGGGDAAGRKKLRLSKEQAAFLEETFKEHNTLNPKQKLALGKQLNLRPRQVEVWFQNRRARTKLKQTEVDCEYLKRCCENLTQENRRLQKEVNDLRTLKLSPQFYMNMNPPTTLTMCPQCERVAVSASSSASAASPAPPAPGARQQNVQPQLKQRVAMNPWSAIFPSSNQPGHRS